MALIPGRVTRTALLTLDGSAQWSPSGSGSPTGGNREHKWRWRPIDQSMACSTDADVIERSLVEPQQFGEIFDRHVERLHGYLSRRVGRDSADGLVGELFRIAFERRGSYDLDRADALPWLYGIGSNLVRQHRRSEHRQLRLTARLAALRDLNDTNTDTDGALSANRDLDAVIAALAELPEADRDVVVLFAWEELTYDQIADALGVPTGTVKSRLNRARSRIREHLWLRGQVVGEPSEHDPLEDRR
jgi:RNA polymerase sigma factor (sigma-70 family)